MSAPSHFLSLSESKIPRAGLAKGSPLPKFTVKGLDGASVSPEKFHGQPFLLVLSDLACSPCNLLIAQLDVLSHRAPETNIFLISKGDHEENDRKFAKISKSIVVGIQRNLEVSKVFQLYLTPAAFLIGDHGKIDAAPAVGVSAVIDLFRAAAIKNLLANC